MKVEKTSSSIFELENRAFGDKVIFTIERMKDDSVNYFIQYMGVEIMMNDTEFYDFKEMVNKAYKIGLEEQEEN